MTSNDKLEDLLRQMYAQEEETIDTSDIVDEEWHRFEARHFAPKRRSWGWMQIAAAFIGLLKLSGITYAAIHIVSSSRSQQAVENQGDRSLDSVQNHGPVPLIQLSAADSIPQTRIFENAPLDEMITEIAQYYNKVADIESEEAHELRLYYKWEPKDALEDVVADLNHFDHVSLAIEDDKLIVKP